MYIREVENLLPNVNKHSDRVHTRVTRFLEKRKGKNRGWNGSKIEREKKKKYSRLQLYLEWRLPSLFLGIFSLFLSLFSSLSLLFFHSPENSWTVK